MLAAAWLGRGFWGLLRGAGRRRPCGGARPLGSRAEAGGRRHGNGGAFCLAGGARAALALREPRRPLRAPFWSPLCGEAGPRRAGSGGAAPPEPPRERSAAGRYAELLDGFIARNWANQKSALGSALDPLADKILISVLYVSLTCANLIPVSLTSMIILRDVALIAAVFYVRYKTLSPPRTLSRYFNPCYATAQLKPTFISKMNTAVQLILVAASLAAPVFNYVDSVYLQTLWCITAFTTVTSAYSYYHYGRKTVQVINNK
ncbi:cardiolipin synthase (CMP-forming) isoform X3 [Gallus gallus]|uniref:cardiolipin synthase (CMP-forming) isoform X3 n=1 Tax=Gallus gallus TaxID=9031 RepID=UPI000739D6AF|nr:cardiolipin synthase (CMP-forming) isoform X3 [Gallus gallus]